MRPPRRFKGPENQSRALIDRFHHLGFPRKATLTEGLLLGSRSFHGERGLRPTGDPLLLGAAWITLQSHPPRRGEGGRHCSPAPFMAGWVPRAHRPPPEDLCLCSAKAFLGSSVWFLEHLLCSRFGSAYTLGTAGSRCPISMLFKCIASPAHLGLPGPGVGPLPSPQFTVGSQLGALCTQGK